ncbi:unnamed protein product [Orchesella dallaii]|uniref:Dynamin-type G domain-containing protein n=1 Tax=Orchesella dallaii TaxID=48710 RepID=A0ABP1R6H4_9HEXA
MEKNGILQYISRRYSSGKQKGEFCPIMDESKGLIELVNKLQKYFKSTGCGPRKIELPQIVVVGAQSSGKSSVLDGLIGFSILPRGSGTVTKCPIIVQLITIAETKDKEEEGIELEDFPDDGRSQDYDEVRRKITELMERNGGAITDTPIIVRVYSPNVVTLTVVDLPGIKRLTSAGEPSNLEKLIFALSRKYINEKNAIILAVSPANYEICNSDGLLLAKEADPNGNRTIGVLTKLDLMDEGTNARELLTGVSKDVQVKLGMIGLVNRSQKDIDNNFSVQMQMAKEKDFLSKHYADLAAQNGVPYLRKRLHKLLVQHILKCLPKVLDDLDDLLKHCNKRLDEIPDVMTKKDQLVFVYKVSHRFENRLKIEIEGSTRRPEYRHLYGGVLIKDIFEKRFAEDMEVAEATADESITDSMILRAFRNSGSFDSMFGNPEAVFRRLAQNQIKYIEKPALKCADRVNEEIIKIVDRNLAEGNGNIGLKYFLSLRKLLKTTITSLLDANLETVKNQIKDYIRVQSSVIFSLDAAFLQTIADLRRRLEKQLYAGEDSSAAEDEADSVASLPDVPNGSSNVASYGNVLKIGNGKKLCASNGNRNRLLMKLKEPECINLIKEMVKNYFRLVKSHIQDFVPKLIADRLIIPFSEDDGSLGIELRDKIMDNYESLTQLPADVRASRERDVQLKEHLKEIILEVKEILNVDVDENCEEGKFEGDQFSDDADETESEDL